MNEIKVNKPFAPPKEFPIEINLNNSISIFKYLHDLGYRWILGRSLIDDYYRDHIFRGGDKTFYIYPASNNSKQLYISEDIVATKPKIPIEKLSEIKVNPPLTKLVIDKEYLVWNASYKDWFKQPKIFKDEFTSTRGEDYYVFISKGEKLSNISVPKIYLQKGLIKPYKEETNEIFSKEWWKETLDLDEIKVTVPINFPIEIKSDQDWLRYRPLFIKNGYNYCNGIKIELDDTSPFFEWDYPVILISDIDKNVCVANRNINEIKVVNPNVPTRFPLKVNKNSWSYVANYLDKKGYTWINGKKLINWDPFIHGKLEQFGINPDKDDIYLAVYDDGSISWSKDIKTAIKNIHPYLEIPIKDYNTINESSPINFEDDDYQTYITQNRDKIEKAAAFFNLPILDMEDIFLSGKEVILSDDIWKNLENSKSYRIKTLDDAIKNALKAGIDPKPYIENIKKGEDLPLPLVLCYGIDKYYLVGGEVILSLYRALGSIPTILQGNLNVGRKEEVIEEDTTNKKEQTQKLIKKFIQFVVKEIGLKKLPSKIKISYNTGRAKEDHSFGAFDPNNNEIWLYVKDRAPADFLRTLAHELVHRKQAEEGRIYFDSGSTGSEIENEANAQAGVLMRKFGEQNSEIFDGELLSEIKVTNPNYPKEFPIEVTEETYPRIAKYLDRLGYKWASDHKLTEWNPFKARGSGNSVIRYLYSGGGSYILQSSDMNSIINEPPVSIINQNPYLDEIKLNLQEGIYGDYLFGDKESGVRIKWYDKELEEDTPAEKELFTRLKAYADSEFETYSNMNIDDLKPLFDKLKIEYPDIANPNLQGDSYIYRGTTTTIDKLEELKQLPNISEDKRNIIIPNQEYSSQRQLSSWSTNYFNAASFAIATAERKGMVPLIVRAKVKDAELYFNPEFMNKLSSQPEEEVLNSTNPINVDVLIIKGFDTELYDDEYLDEIKINKPVIPLKAYKNPSGAIYLLFNGKNKNSTLKSYINYVGWSNKNNSIIYFGLEPHIKKDFTNKLKQKGISYVYDEDGLGLGIDIKYFDIKPTSKYSLYDEDINGWYNKISEDLDEIKVTVPINFPITVSSAEEFKLITDKLYKNGYRYIWKALNGEGEFKPDPFTDWISPAKEIVIDYINIENHPELSQESWEVLKNAKLLDYKQIEMSKLWQNQN